MSTGEDTAVRPFERIVFGSYDIKVQYDSPYPTEEVMHVLRGADKGMDIDKLFTTKPKKTIGSSAVLPKSTLFVCEGCFKYMPHAAAYARHTASCKTRHPPGRRVYRKDSLTIWEVDGAHNKLYCQCLCLFAKLFIEHKYVFFDVEGFMFYILTEETRRFNHAVGYFSKEKVSYDDNNLNCIVAFPPFQRKNYGTLLIEFSYALATRSSASPGSPERPLSKLGRKGYLTYWTGVIIRYLETLFPENRAPGRRVGSFQDGFLLTSLEEIAASVNIRIDDVAFTLLETGLAQWRRKIKRPFHEEDDAETFEIIITHDLLMEIKATRRLKEPVLDPKCILL